MELTDEFARDALTAMDLAKKLADIPSPNMKPSVLKSTTPANTTAMPNKPPTPTIQESTQTTQTVSRARQINQPPRAMPRVFTAPVMHATVKRPNDAVGNMERIAFPNAGVEGLSAELPTCMTKGTKMTMFKPGKKDDVSERILHVDTRQLRIIWYSRNSNKEKYVNVESIIGCRTGDELPAEFRNHTRFDKETMGHALNITYMDDSRCRSLYLVPEDEKTQKEWLAGLEILAKRYCHQNRENEKAVTESESVWLRRQWCASELEPNETMSWEQFFAICQKMNVAMPKKELKQKYKVGWRSKTR
jgi:hypothetical protein